MKMITADMHQYENCVTADLRKTGDGRYHILIQSPRQCNYEYIIYEPEDVDDRTHKTKHRESIYSEEGTSDIVIQTWRTSEYDVVTDVIASRMLDGYNTSKQMFRDSAGFIVLNRINVKKKKRDNPKLYVHNIDRDDVEGNSIIGITAIMVPGIEIDHEYYNRFDSIRRATINHKLLRCVEEVIDGFPVYDNFVWGLYNNVNDTKRIYPANTCGNKVPKDIWPGDEW